MNQNCVVELDGVYPSIYLQNNVDKLVLSHFVLVNYFDTVLVKTWLFEGHSYFSRLVKEVTIEVAESIIKPLCWMPYSYAMKSTCMMRFDEFFPHFALKQFFDPKKEKKRAIWRIFSHNDVRILEFVSSILRQINWFHVHSVEKNCKTLSTFFRQIKVFTIETTKKLISQKILSVIVFYSIFTRCDVHSEQQENS